MKKLLVLFSMFAAAPALAQQSDPDFMAKAISSLQAQRNSALDAAAIAEAKAAQANEKVSKLEQQLKAAAETPHDKPPEVK